MKTLQFWFEFASTYTYPTSQRLQAAADETGVRVEYRPGLGHSFAAGPGP